VGRAGRKAGASVIGATIGTMAGASRAAGGMIAMNADRWTDD